jgi:hypothetical protein
VAEWLRSGLQNRLHQFNSGRGLHFITLILHTYFIVDLVRQAGLLPELLPLLFLPLLHRRFERGIHQLRGILLHPGNDVAVEI